MKPIRRPSPDLRSRRARDGGFSLVEVMVAVTIVVVGVLGLANSIVASDRLEQSTRRESVRARAVNDALEQLRNGSLVTRAQEFAAHADFTENGQKITVHFPAAVLAHRLPRYSSTTSPFLPSTNVGGDYPKSGDLAIVPANSAAPGILPVELTITTEADPIVLESLAANR